MRTLRSLRARRHVILATVSFANFVVAALHFGLASAGPQLRANLDIDEATLGLVLALPALGLMSGTFFWGVLADRLGERRVLAGSFAAFTVAAAWLATQIDGVGLDLRLGSALLLIGLFGGAAHSAGARAITAAYPEHRRGLALSLRHAAIPLGGAAGGVWIPAVTDARSMSVALALFAILGVVAMASLWMVVPGSHPQEVRLLDSHESFQALPRSPLRDRSMQLLCLGCAGLAIVQLGLGSFFTLFLVDEAGMTLAGAAIVFGVVQASGTFSRVALGVLSDRAGDRALILRAVGVACGAVVATGFLAPSAGAQAACLGLVLMLATSWNGVAMAVAASLAPPGRDGATIGMLVTANAAACAAAPVVLGVVLGRSGWAAFQLGLLASLVIATVSFTALVRARDRLATDAG